MRIAQIAPLAESVPPKFYGGTERVIAWLTNELIDLGHKVTLFASGDSVTRAELVPVWPRALRLGRPRTDPMAAHAALLEAMAQRASEFDIVHCHIDWTHLPLLSRHSTPFVTTFHGRLDLPGLSTVVRKFPSAPFVSISDNQRVPLKEANWLGTVYHGMPAALLQPSFAEGSYLAFLGRLTSEKGPEAAIRIAKTAGVPLHIAAKLPRSERGYFKEKVEPMIDGTHIKIIGEVNDQTKQRLPLRRQSAGISDPMARAFRVGDDRGHGLRHAGDRVSLRFGAGSDRGRCHRLHRRVGRGSDRDHQASPAETGSPKGARRL